ncbi:hypothetical protein B0T26DRAFT_176551 [Lasiosphaeria miniovina]|uniref:LCCL domain-containing protein n=1 Tax=Lasiosphaeria miniovina TaxID=1954250 RepID=A0AA40B6L9_9PEZI|nr:uncharacterized protein B0T26DRAFT_176551 [Lasiosphaeria miniovina]KAK0728559.1 hypothetical protein B0T26DRAFT_176551 [Lasiosphaeria miniovina]
MGENGTEVRSQARDVEGQESTSTSASASSTNVVVPEHPDAPIVEAALVNQNDDSRPPTPRFIQDERSWKRWKWVPYPVRRLTIAVYKWAQGPPSPNNFKIQPLLPSVQRAPVRLLDKFLPRKSHRAWLVFFYLSIWIVTFALVMRQGQSATEIDGWGTPSAIGCGNTYWAADNGCGLDGNDCRPFDGGGFAFKCPASCESYQVLNPHAVGATEVVYQPLVIGGPGSNGSAVYRGDSFICGAAIHAGVISNTVGGCGVVKLIGLQRDFNSSTQNGISSVGFDSYFPLSFTFETGTQCVSRDTRWPLLAVSVVFSTVLALFVTSPALFFFPVFTGIYWTVGLATDPPGYSSIAGLFSNELGNFLPAVFTAWVMYDKMGVRRTLKGLTAQVEKSVLWLGGCWVGALTNYTFDFIPIQRLTPHDLDQQPGARAALAIIIIVLAVVAVSQIWFFRQEGRLVKYLKLYALLVAAIVISVVLPGLSLRIHHYILALLLLPGTSMQTRPSLLYQGILVGLFLNGIARWGWDSFLQTAAALQGDAQLGSPLPSIPAPNITLGSALSSITFTWGLSPGPELDGLSVLVNDVERFRTYFADEFDSSPNFTWTRRAGLEENEYFRFAWMQGSGSEDYTKAGTWNAKGEWVAMQPGPSRVRARSAEGGRGEGILLKAR